MHDTESVETNSKPRFIQTDVYDGRETINDQFDIYELSSRFHGTNEIINRDFTLSWTNAKLENWIERQLVEVARVYEILKQLNDEIADETKKMMMTQVNLRIVFTRSRGGRVLKSGLSFNRDEDFEKKLEEKKQMGMIGKLFSTKKEIEENKSE